ncbi:MAG TPA: replication initiation protein [Trueperaceae bacterium]|nr:replication initiation protein [Trueperaceae bacterium]
MISREASLRGEGVEPDEPRGGGHATTQRSEEARAEADAGERARAGDKGRGKPASRSGGSERRGANLSITQANPLALSRQEMGILTKRLLVLALSDITREDDELEPIRITAWEYAQLFNIKGKSIYSRIEQSARELLEQTVQIKEPNGDWVMFQWVSEARYENGRDSKEQMACIELKVHEKLKPYLLQLRRDFSIIPTEQLLSFESFNSMRLFEVLYTASYAGERSELVFDIEDLKLRLGLDGKYDRFKDFRYVLDKAQAEFKRYTCLVFSYRAEKVGRKYRRVHFAIVKNEVFKPRVRLPASLANRVKRETDTEQLVRELQARDALQEIGWAQDSDRTIQRYGAQRVVDIVAYARKLSGKAEAAGRPIFNLAGFVNNLLQQGVEPPKAPPQDDDQRLSREEVRSIATSIADSFHQHRRQRAEESWAQLTEEQRELIHTLMQATLHRFTLERIEADAWRGGLYESSRMEVMASHNFVTFPTHLQDVTVFVRTLDLLAEYADDNRKAILAELRESD